jgi:hypothetical protein
MVPVAEFMVWWVLRKPVNTGAGWSEEPPGPRGA